jgi:hypothetical protein
MSHLQNLSDEKLDERIASLKRELEKLEQEKSNRLALACDSDDIGDNDGNRVTDKDDRQRILNDMSKDMDEHQFKTHTKKLESLFWHWSNVNFVYTECKLECPQWYVEKYGVL